MPELFERDFQSVENTQISFCFAHIDAQLVQQHVRLQWH